MRSYLSRAFLLASTILLLVALPSGALGKAEPGVYVEDFEEGVLLDWQYDEGTAKITETAGGAAAGVPDPTAAPEAAGNAALHMPGAGEAVLRDREFSALLLAVDVRGNGGVRCGGRYAVLLTSDFGGSLTVGTKEGETLARVKLAATRAGYSAAGTHRLKVVSAGSLLRVYVDGRAAFEKTDARSAKAPIALVAGKEGAIFDNLRVSAAIPPAEGTLAVPKVENEALVFTAGQAIELSLHAANRSKRDVRLVAAVRPFKGIAVTEEERKKAEAAGQTVVAYGVSKFYRIETLADKTLARGETAVKAGTEGRVLVKLGELPAGLHMLDLSLLSEDKQLSNRIYPLAVVDKGALRQYAPPTVPVAVYTRLMHYRRTMEPLWWKTYVHAIAHDLSRRGLNTIVACGGFDPGEIDIYNSYGIAGVSRDGRWLDHPGVIASFVSDEPHPGEEMEQLKQRYAELREKTDKIITTCMVGEGMGLGGGGDPVSLWKELQPQVRVFRWYGVKKHFYGILHPLHYKGTLPFTSVLRIAEASDDTPWWVILPAFGGTQHEAYFQSPSPSQVKGMMHLALAYGADGILLFQYQGGLVDPVTLKPLDGKLAAAGEVAAKVARHAALLASLKHGGLDVRCPSPFVEALPLHGGGDEGPYVYAVNKNTKGKVSTHLLLWAEVWELTTVQDLFSGEKLEVTHDEEGYLSVPVVLAPGEGKLLVTDAKQKK